MLKSIFDFFWSALSKILYNEKMNTKYLTNKYARYNMEKRIVSIIICFSIMSFSSVLTGQTSIDAEFRPRTEFRQGFRKPLSDTLNTGLVTLQRTRLNAFYNGRILNARISLQDSRIWGNSNNKTNSSKIEIYEAWFDYLIISGLSLKMGRQELKYDDQRLLAAPNWSNTGIAHDVMVLKYNSPFIQVHAGFAYNNSKDTICNTEYSYNPKDNYKTMAYSWLSKSIYNTKFSLIGIYEGFEKRTDYNVIYPRITYGGNIFYSNDSSEWEGNLTAYFQTGKNPGKKSGKEYADLRAYFLAAKASYKINNLWKFTSGIDYFSGTSTNIDAGKSYTFNRLYGVTHGFNGSMEYYVSLPAQGLIDYYSGLNVLLPPDLSIDLTGHFFNLDKELIYNNVGAGKNLGGEADLTMNYKVSKEITIQGGYSMYFNSDTTPKYFKVEGKNIQPQQWIYMMLTIKPQLYKTPPPDSNQ